MPRVLLTLAILGLTIYAVIDCVRSEGSGRMRGPTWAWVTLIVVLPIFGALIWLAVARAADAAPEAGRRPMPKAPDDDPDFLRYLQQQNRRAGAGTPDRSGDQDDQGDQGESSNSNESTDPIQPEKPRPDPDDERRGRKNDGHASDDRPTDGRDGR